MTYHIYLYKLIMLCKTTVISRMSHCPSWSSNFVPRPVSGCAKDHWRMTHLAASSWRVVAVVRNKFNVWVADKITYYPQWTWPKWVAPYRLWMFSHKFEHPMSTLHYLSLLLILSVTRLLIYIIYNINIYIYTILQAISNYIKTYHHIMLYLWVL